MSDTILEEIRRVREELIKRHGGLDGYLDFIQKLDCARRQRGRKSRGKIARKRKTEKIRPRRRLERESRTAEGTSKSL
jgi:hypothetical protein